MATASSQTTTTIRKLMDGKLRLERRNNNPKIYARTYVQGKTLVFGTKETRLDAAERVATEWWLGLQTRVQNHEDIHAPTFASVAAKFLDVAERDHNAGQVRNFKQKWSLLKPYFGDLKPKDIDKGWLLGLRGNRAKSVTKTGEPVKPATLKKDMLFIRLVLRYAKDELKSLRELPEFPSFTRNSKWEIRPAGRPRFTKSEFKLLLKTAFRRMREPNLNPRTKRQRAELYYLILIATYAALRVDEAYSLRWRDCSWYLLDDSDQTEMGRRGLEVVSANLLEAWVLGKHSRDGEREEARGNPLAFFAYVHLKRERAVELGVLDSSVARLKADADIKLMPDDKLFTHGHRDGFRELLNAARNQDNPLGLRKDPATGRLRNLKSLRPTGISLQLEQSENPNYIDIAHWTRTSVAMIEKFYDQRRRGESMARVMAPRARRMPD